VEVTESSVLQLPFTASSVGVARRHLVSDLIEAGVCAAAVTDAALVISELLSNALQHAGPLPGAGMRVTWELEDGSVRVAVSDGGGTSRPELGQPTSTTTGGRGLRIVARLSRRWGTLRDEEGTTVWAEVLVMPLETMAVPAAAAESGGLAGGARGGRPPVGAERESSPRGNTAGLVRRRSANSQHALNVATWLPGARRGKVRLVELNVSSRFHDDHTIVTICGEIDLYTAPRLHSELAGLLADGMPTRVIIDMSGVEFCDSTGMNVLLSCLRRARERGGELEIAAPKPAVRKILQVTGLDSVFTLVEAADLRGSAGLSRPKPAVPQ
jgi:anti-sigma B factor antagonist